METPPRGSSRPDPPRLRAGRRNGVLGRLRLSEREQQVALTLVITACARALDETSAEQVYRQAVDCGSGPADESAHYTCTPQTRYVYALLVHASCSVRTAITAGRYRPVSPAAQGADQAALAAGAVATFPARHSCTPTSSYSVSVALHIVTQASSIDRRLRPDNFCRNALMQAYGKRGAAFSEQSTPKAALGLFHFSLQVGCPASGLPSLGTDQQGSGRDVHV